LIDLSPPEMSTRFPAANWQTHPILTRGSMTGTWLEKVLSVSAGWPLYHQKVLWFGRANTVICKAKLASFLTRRGNFREGRMSRYGSPTGDLLEGNLSAQFAVKRNWLAMIGRGGGGKSWREMTW